MGRADKKKRKKNVLDSHQHFQQSLMHIITSIREEKEFYFTTFEPIWLPHCPICRCTISRMMVKLQYTEQLGVSDNI